MQRVIGVSQADVFDVSVTEDSLQSFERRTGIRSSRTQLESYDVHQPRAELSCEIEAKPAAGSNLVARETSCGIDSHDRVKQAAKIHRERQDAARQTYHGAGFARTITAGTVISINPFEEDLLVTHVYFSATTGQAKHAERSFHSGFEAISSEFTYRPPLVTPQPDWQSTLPAIVVGAQGSTGF